MLVELFLSVLRFEDPDLFVQVGNHPVLVPGFVGFFDKRRELLVLLQFFISLDQHPGCGAVFQVEGCGFFELCCSNIPVRFLQAGVGDGKVAEDLDPQRVLVHGLEGGFEGDDG